MRFSDLWKWEGTVDRDAYAMWGCVLFAIKYNLDRLVATFGFHRSWWITSYYVPNASLFALNPDDRRFFLTLLVLAVPFIWIGTSFTVRRLRSLGFPLWLVFFFFIPFVNLLFFAILCTLPSKDQVQLKPRTMSESLRGFFDRLIPDSKAGAIAMALLVNTASGVLFALLSVQALKNYGWGLFVGLPFCLGLTSVLIYSYRERRTLGQCIAISALSVLVICVALLVIAFEGVFCLAMAAPIAGVLAILGGTIGYAIQFHPDNRTQAPRLYSLMLIALPLLMTAEHYQAPPAQVFEVRSSIDIQAAPETVWEQVIAFSEIPPPKEWLFRIGIAYPIRAHIDGSGAGAMRHCIFTTGEFLEPIQIWDEPRLLKFSVLVNPPPLREWTPYQEIRPPHLAGFLLSRARQFRLIALPNGSTRLEGTTWYQHHLWPEQYWKLWSDFIIHKIHLRVLNHIKSQSEPQNTNMSQKKGSADEYRQVTKAPS
jgi:uncharacterized membrane protein YhaH (DUF805 family)